MRLFTITSPGWCRAFWELDTPPRSWSWHAVMSLLCGIAATGVDRRGIPFGSSAGETEGWGAYLAAWRVAIWAAAILQFVHLGYLPWKQIPPRENLQALAGLLDTVAKQPGDVWVVSHGFVSQRAGKPAHALANRSFAGLVVDSKTAWMPIGPEYNVIRPLYSTPGHTLEMVCGYPTDPNELRCPLPVSSQTVITRARTSG